MHSLIKIIKEYWNIYGSVIISAIASWLLNWNAEQMFTLNQYIGITISVMCFLTMVKFIIKPKEKKTLLENVVSTQPSVKKTDLIIHQEEQIQQTKYLPKIIRKVGKGIMNKFKLTINWIKNYWQQIIGLLGDLALATLVVYAFITDRFGWLLQFFPTGIAWEIGIKISVGILSALFIFFQVRNQVKWVGVGSITKAREYLKQLGTTLTSSMSKEGKTLISNALTAAKKALKSAKATLIAAQSKYDNAYKEFNTQNEFIKSLISVNANASIQTDAKLKLTELQQLVTAAGTKLSEAKSVVAKYEKEIADYERILNM